MFIKRTQSVFDGGPVTHERIDKNGQLTITVQVKAIGPKMSQLADFLSYGVAGVTAIASIGGAIMLNEASPVKRGAMLFIPIPTYFAAKHVFYQMFSRTKPVRCTLETTSFRKGLRIKHFDMNMPCGWLINEHPKAGLEKRKSEVRKEKQKLATPSSFSLPFYFKPFHEPYLANSRIVSFEYMGQRIDLIKTKSLEEAQEIVARLNAVHEVIEGRSSSDRGIATSPDQAWGRETKGKVINHRRSVS